MDAPKTNGSAHLNKISKQLDKLFASERFCCKESNEPGELSEVKQPSFQAPFQKPLRTLLIVPPFIRLTNASLGVHILQACAHNHNGDSYNENSYNENNPPRFQVSILYANVFFAELIGQDLYNAITFSSDKKMLGDRVFSAAAYHKNTFTPEFNRTYQQAPETAQLEGLREFTISLEALQYASEQANVFSKLIAEKVAHQGFNLAGCTSMFNQTAASIAFINAIKAQQPEIITLMGGANCAGEMAQGMASLSPQIDYIFSGESETAFVEFLHNIATGNKPENQIIVGKRCDNLDAIPTPEFTDYYQQIDLSDINFDWTYVHMPFESSRGCWWGQKYQCTFCGVHELRYRMKSPERVLQQLTEQLKQHRSNYVNFCDDIMPMQYFKTLLPQLQQTLPNIRFFIDQKANLSFRKVKALADAGVYDILPGIETLCSELLTAIDKGTNAKQNLQMMRYARGCNLQLSWFFLYGIPGETPASYEKMRKLLPLIIHLCPPVNFQDIKLLRFGLYVANPSAYGVTNLKPLPVYHDILPDHANIQKLAYYFEGDYSSVISHAPELVSNIASQVQLWRESWYGNASHAVNYDQLPQLSISRVSSTQYLLTDSRDRRTRFVKREFINEQQAAAALVARPLLNINTDKQAEHQWALENGVAVELDGWLVPLATTTPDLFAYFEDNYNPVRQHVTGKLIEVEEQVTQG